MGLTVHVAAASLVFAMIAALDLPCKRSENCTCSYNTDNEYEFQCMSFNGNVEQLQTIVKIQPQYSIYSIRIDCFNKTLMLPPASDMQTGDTDLFDIQACPLPSNFLEFMNTFGANRTDTLCYEYFDLDNVTLTREYFAGLDGLTRLSLERNNLKYVDENVFEEMPSLTELSLQNNVLQLHPTMFDYLPNLIILDLATNKITELPKGIFKQLHKLKTLHLWNNNLKRLDSDVFIGLHKLSSLELSSNKLEELPEEVFLPLTNLKTINLSSNNIRNVFSTLFKNNAILESVRWSRNRNITFPNQLLSNLTKLSKVELKQNSLIFIPGDIFVGSHNITEIYLTDNRLREIPVELFNNLSNLRVVDLSGNQLQYLESETFDSLINLKELNLANNLLTEIRINVFENLKNLAKLYLEKNNIHHIGLRAFKGIENLLELNIASNMLILEETHGVTAFNRLTKLESLDLSHNLITDFVDDFVYTKSKLELLNLSFNKINTIKVTTLQSSRQGKFEIDLSNNEINFIDFEAAEVMAQNQPGLDIYSSVSYSTEVNLAYNPINCDCQAFDLTRYYHDMLDPRVRTLINLQPENLKCSEPLAFKDINVVTVLPKYLTCPLSNIVANYTECSEKCGCDWRPWDKAIIADCINNNLTEVPQIYLPENFEKHNQTEVHLEYNMLSSAPGANDSGYENVTKLFLSHNQIQGVTWIPPKIELLRLDNNDIGKLDYSILKRLNESAVNVTLHHNPWICDCSTVNLTRFIRQKTNQIDPTNILCRESIRKLIDLNEKDLCQTYTVLILVTAITIAFLLFIIAVGLAFFYRYQKEIKVWLFAHNFCMWWVTEEEIDKDKEFDIFLCFSQKDDDFVKQELLSVLENGPEAYKVCVHFRDWKGGEFIHKQIADSVQNSRRTLILLSKDFLKSVWGQLEFKVAHRQSMAEGRARVILVLYGEIDVNADLDDELKAYIKTNTYVKWGEPWFWNKIKYALPHSQNKHKIKVTANQQKHANIMQTLDDKFSLVQPASPNLGTTPPIIQIDSLIKGDPLNFSVNNNKSPVSLDSGLNPLLITVNK